LVFEQANSWIVDVMDLQYQKPEKPELRVLFCFVSFKVTVLMWSITFLSNMPRGRPESWRSRY